MQISFRLQSLSNWALLLRHCITALVLYKEKDDWVKHFDTAYLRWKISIHQRDLSFDSVNGWFPAAPQNCWYWSDFLTRRSMGGTRLTLSLEKEACSLYIYINLTTRLTQSPCWLEIYVVFLRNKSFPGLFDLTWYWWTLHWLILCH